MKETFSDHMWFVILKEINFNLMNFRKIKLIIIDGINWIFNNFENFTQINKSELNGLSALPAFPWWKPSGRTLQSSFEASFSTV